MEAKAQFGRWRMKMRLPQNYENVFACSKHRRAILKRVKGNLTLLMTRSKNVLNAWHDIGVFGHTKRSVGGPL